MQAVGASIAGREHVSVVRVKAQPLAAGEAATAWTRLWTSAVAAGVSEAATMPIDFAKVRLQLQSRTIGGASAAAGVLYSGMADCIVRTVRAEGPGALYRGIGPALARQVGYTGLSFLLYEPVLNRISPKGARTSLPAPCSPAGVCPGMSVRSRAAVIPVQGATQALPTDCWPGVLRAAWEFQS